jgi:hypothetical protein
MRMENRRSMNRTAWTASLGLFFAVVMGSFGILQAATLSDGEQKDLIFIREEEKLARDVYLTLYDFWGSRIFSNISSSEQTHMDAVKGILDKYGIPDPAAGMGIGEFSDLVLQDLYTELVDLGSETLIGAMEVGVIIEEKDILDINEALDRTTHRDVIRVYTNLLAGSYNHLTAFNDQLTKLVVTLEP